MMLWSRSHLGFVNPTGLCVLQRLEKEGKTRGASVGWSVKIPVWHSAGLKIKASLKSGRK